MVLLLHILSATASLVLAVVAFFYPSKTKLNFIYGLTAAMLITGSYLVYSKPAHLTQTCISGLAYLAVIMTAIFAVRHKLGKQTT